MPVCGGAFREYLRDRGGEVGAGEFHVAAPAVVVKGLPGSERAGRQHGAAAPAVERLLVSVRAADGVAFPIHPHGIHGDAGILEFLQGGADVIGVDLPAFREKRAGVDGTFRGVAGVEVVRPFLGIAGE